MWIELVQGSKGQGPKGLKNCQDAEADGAARLDVPVPVHVRETAAPDEADEEPALGAEGVLTPLPGTGGAEIREQRAPMAIEPQEEVADQVPLLDGEEANFLGADELPRLGEVALELVPGLPETAVEAERLPEQIVAVARGIVPVRLRDSLHRDPLPRDPSARERRDERLALDQALVEVLAPHGLYEVRGVVLLGDRWQVHHAEAVLLHGLGGLARELGEGRNLDLTAEDFLPHLLPEGLRLTLDVGRELADRRNDHLLELASPPEEPLQTVLVEVDLLECFRSAVFDEPTVLLLLFGRDRCTHRHHPPFGNACTETAVPDFSSILDHSSTPEERFNLAPFGQKVKI
ncbi:MAG: hypothetical protein UY77_C0002G0009 [Candidatus Uhrbacteria bacterium GW2011_GWA2_53_10]|uniref:Uncharacterized protein n=1 Tax=Candidatus Uhrbacteria bacterium GW2011_GWA2_53_10 TaxID=1618980 RepID=A0A0G1XQQ9_9BACT|nr:MAG: hypothetical protein UY77_C0002G0009 [Candidatus Uhrbacteria bacterium GW2011_GWA2_53_10]